MKDYIYIYRRPSIFLVGGMTWEHGYHERVLKKEKGIRLRRLRPCCKNPALTEKMAKAYKKMIEHSFIMSLS